MAWSPVGIQNGAFNPAATQILRDLIRDITPTGTTDGPAVSVLEFGAAPGTGAPQQDAFNRALQAARQRGAALTIPEGVFTFTDTVDIPTGSRIIMTPATVLDWGSFKGTFLRAQGISGEPVASEPITKGSMLIPTGVETEAGRYLHVTSNELVDAFSTKINKGELLPVSSVAVGGVSVGTPAADSYTTEVRVSSVEMARDISIQSGVIKGGKTAALNQVGLEAIYVQNLVVDRVRFVDIDDSHTRLTNCVGAKITSCEFDWAVHTTRGYGVSFKDATADSVCIDSVFRNVRHTLSTNNSSAPQRGGVVRRILFFNNRCEYTSTALGGSRGPGDCIDTHTAAEDIWIASNTVNGSSGIGVNVECISATVVDNKILNAGSHGIYVHNEADRRGRVLISGNIVENAGRAGIIAQAGTRGANLGYESITVVNNQVNRTGEAGIRIGTTSTAGFKDEGVICSGNTVLESKSHGICVYKVNGGSIQGNFVRNPGGTGLLLDGGTNLSVGPDTIITDLTQPTWYGIAVNNASNIMVTPGAISSATATHIGVRVNATASNVAIGPSDHLSISRKVDNRQPAAG